MARTWVGSWLGGRAFRRRGKRPFWAIERMVNGERFSKTLEAKSEVSLEAISATMGHQSKRTTGFFYWGVKIPSMIHSPIKLKHREDPVIG